jgi:hypothetical protein
MKKRIVIGTCRLCGGNKILHLSKRKQNPLHHCEDCGHWSFPPIDRQPTVPTSHLWAFYENVSIIAGMFTMWFGEGTNWAVLGMGLVFSGLFVGLRTRRK